MNKLATNYLNNLKHISFNELGKDYQEFVLLFNNDLIYEDNNKLSIINSNKKVNLKDLLRVIKIINPIECLYEDTNVLIPRTYAEAHNPIPNHISVQCLMFGNLKDIDIDELKRILNSITYNKTSYDNIWIGKDKTIDNLTQGDILYLMNRRVGGWDGSVDRPVIELLCAGGHLPTIWNDTKRTFETMDVEDLLIQEIEEEIKILVHKNQLIKLGGFHNKVSNELVIVYGMFVTNNQLFNIIDLSKGNLSENIDGIYLGEFSDVMNLYRDNSSIFAGGTEASKTNFPNDKILMKRINEILIK